MSETKFTSREWTVEPSETPGVLEIDCGGMMGITVVTSAYDLSYSDMVERTANAHLIASAPEMYELLLKARREIDYLDESLYDARGGGEWKQVEILDEIDELLAKARGEQQ